MKICKALEGFGGFRNALEALGMLSEALGRLDVNTVCPLPGSWINHVFSMAWEAAVDYVCLFSLVGQQAALAAIHPW